MNEEQTAHLQSVVEQLHAGHRQHVELLAQLQKPAKVTVHRLTAEDPIDHDSPSAEARTRSIGVYNPTPITVYLGVGGGSASAAAEAFPCPPGSLLVLPIAVTQAELGADVGDLAAGDAVLFVLRFDTVQPAFLGAL